MGLTHQTRFALHSNVECSMQTRSSWLTGYNLKLIWLSAILGMNLFVRMTFRISSWFGRVYKCSTNLLAAVLNTVLSSFGFSSIYLVRMISANAIKSHASVSSLRIYFLKIQANRRFAFLVAERGFCSRKCLGTPSTMDCTAHLHTRSRFEQV